jgi:GntR family transcriptional regulator
MNLELVLSQNDSRPMYQQIMEQIKHRIALGDWPVGEKLASIRELAVGLKVSVITVKRAYEELEKEGVIVTQHGRGSFIATGPELGDRINEETLTNHLQEAAKLAYVMGIPVRELAGRLEQLHKNLTEETRDE